MRIKAERVRELRTEFNLSVCDDEVRCAGFVVDLSRLVQEHHQSFRVNQVLVDLAVDVTELSQGAVELACPFVVRLGAKNSR